MGEFRKDLLPDAASYHESEGDPLKGPGPWGTRGCPFHGGSDSMRVNRASGGFACMACGEKGGDVLAFHMKAHGLEFIPAAKALGAWIDDGKPYRGPTRPRRLPASEALHLLYEDSLLACVAAGNIANGVTLTDRDRADLWRAHNRIRLVSQEARL
jgi:DNA primase